MNPVRKDQWAKRLRQRADEEAGRDFSETTYWLTERLTDYLARWLAFACSEEINVDSTLNGDLFSVVLAAIDVISECQKASVSSVFPKSEWDRFCSCISAIQSDPNQLDLKAISEAFDAFRNRVMDGGSSAQSIKP